MSTLVVIGYDDQFKAEEVRLSLMKMQKDYLIDLGDAVVAVKDQEGKVKLHQAVNMTAAGAVSGGFWGTLIGLIFLNPLIGLAVGATTGAVSGALTDLVKSVAVDTLDGRARQGRVRRQGPGRTHWHVHPRRGAGQPHR